MVDRQYWSASNGNVCATGYNGQTICQPVTYWGSVVCAYMCIHKHICIHICKKHKNIYIYIYIYQRVHVTAMTVKVSCVGLEKIPFEYYIKQGTELQLR